VVQSSLVGGIAVGVGADVVGGADVDDDDFEARGPGDPQPARRVARTAGATSAVRRAVERRRARSELLTT